jgi:hypothetical protein
MALTVVQAGCREGDETARGPSAPARPGVGAASATSPGSAGSTAPVVVAPKPLLQSVLPRPVLLTPLRAAAAASSAVPTASPPSGDRTPSTTAPAAPGNDLPPAAPPPTAGARNLRLEVHPIDAAQGEDGRGNVVPAAHPMALDVIADAWGGRGLDPVLEVGNQLFRRYRHPGPGVLRYVAADGGALPEGAPVRLRWGEDSGNSVPVAASPAVPR